MNPDWWARRARVAHVGRPSERAAWIFRRLLGPLMRLVHRPTLEGTEQLPDGPFILVANHSGGLGGSEAFALATCWLERFGDARPLAGLAHPFAFSIWPISTWLRGLGAVPSTREWLHTALARGVPVIVFPGGDHEITRPFWEANRVLFAGRSGYLRAAREAGVPVVPMGIRGSAWTVPSLGRSTLVLPNLLVLPRLLGLRRWPVTVLGAVGAAFIALAPGLGGWPIRLALLWGWLASPLPLLPWIPSTIRFRIGKALPPEVLFAQDDPTLEGAARRVEGEVQALVDALAARAPRPEPVRGRP